MANAFQLFGNLPPSVEIALTSRQKSALNRYIMLKVVKQVYYTAYDLASQIEGREKSRRRKRRPSPTTKDER